MDPKKLRYDDRLKGACVYCGSLPDTRDHVPSKVLLDDPLPEDLAVVAACFQCNNGFSADEMYLACLVDTCIAGSTDPEKVSRGKIKRLLAEQPNLRAQIEGSQDSSGPGRLTWGAEVDRVRSIVLKLARGHVAFDMAEEHREPPARLGFSPIVELSPDSRQEFESVPPYDVWPEIGSRAFVETAVAFGQAFSPSGWVHLQPKRYRYAVSCHDGVVDVRFVLSEYLACQVVW